MPSTAAEFYQAKFRRLPERILLIKAHSAGIGDILRSSAAWRALKNAFPSAQLHVLLLTKEPGYASEALMAQHHLLKSFHAVNKRARGIQGWKTVIGQIANIGAEVRPDLIIDCEPNGIRTSLIARLLALKHGAVTVGINQVPPRGIFYHLSAKRSETFASERQLAWPLEYTNRDFVALSALKIERNGLPIELEETNEGREFRSRFRDANGIPPNARLLGLNIGCGTPGAAYKRPDLEVLSGVVGKLQEKFGLYLVLTGAKFEKDINQQFMAVHTRSHPGPACDLAGATSLSGLTGLIRACTLFVSTDSGPYHMSVAMRTPTLAVFTHNTPMHFHSDPWVRCVLLHKPDRAPGAFQAGCELLAAGPG